MKSISPLRYPGGKSKIFEKILPFFKSSNSKYYAEPFSGGFGLGLLLLENKHVEKVFINDLDVNIYYFWKCLKEDHKYLVKEIFRVLQFKTNIEWIYEREKQLKIISSKCKSYKLRGFATFFLNRVNISGILKAGPIGGVSQKSKYLINCRFNGQKLIEKIENIAKFKNQIFVSRLSYKKCLSILPKNTFVFLDPPYVVKGKNLYKNSFEKEDHKQVEKVLRNFQNPWIMTYDNTELIREIYSNKNFYFFRVFNLNHYAGSFKNAEELLIFPKKKYFENLPVI